MAVECHFLIQVHHTCLSEKFRVKATDQSPAVKDFRGNIAQWRRYATFHMCHSAFSHCQKFSENTQGVLCLKNCSQHNQYTICIWKYVCTLHFYLKIMRLCILILFSCKYNLHNSVSLRIFSQFLHTAWQFTV